MFCWHELSLACVIRSGTCRAMWSAAAEEKSREVKVSSAINVCCVGEVVIELMEVTAETKEVQNAISRL